MKFKVFILTILISLALAVAGCSAVPQETDVTPAAEAAVETKKPEPTFFCYVCGETATRAVRNRSGEVEQYCIGHYNELFGTPESRAKETEHSGIENVLASAKQCAQIKFTPVGVLPSQLGDFPANGEITGLPYSSARANDKMIGNQVSIHTFLSAVQNPRSVLYTRILTTENAKTYYGMVCSGLIDYCFKIEPLFTSKTFLTWDELTEVSYDELKAGDVVNSGGHIALITGVERDEEGKITNVTFTESIKQKVKTTTKSLSDFAEHFNGNYKAYRYKNIDKVGYRQLPYVCGFEDEQIQDNVVFPDIMSEFGDKAALLAGESTVINVINPRDYTSISVKRNGVEIQNISVAEGGALGDFTLNNLKPGMYSVSISNGTESSVSSFFVVDADCRYDAEEKRVYFSSKNAEPVAVYVYNDQPENNVVQLTPEDIENGSCDLSGYIDGTYKYVKVGFKCYYGVATWYSHDLHQWKHIT